MVPYITFNGISSISKGLRLLAAEPFIYPRRTRQREYIPGRLGSIAARDFEMPAVGYRIRLGCAGADKCAVVQALHGIADWILSARLMTVWHDPAAYFTGAVEGESSLSMLTRRNGQLELEFLCDPPCRQHAMVIGDPWFPSSASPIAEQLSDTICTVKQKGKTASFALEAGTVASPLPSALHLRIAGTWANLLIGGSLTVNEAAAGADTLYIDFEAQEVYRVAGAVRTPVSYSGDFPALSGGNLAVGGTAFNIDAHLLVIERG